MKALKDILNKNTKNVSCLNIKDIIKNANANTNIIPPYDKSGYTQSGLGVLYGNLAKDGCVTKISGIDPECYTFEGTAKTFDSEEAAMKALEDDKIKAGVDNVIGITLKSTDVKGLGYDNVLVFFEVNSKPENANVTLTATDSNDNVVDLIETGFWGPSGGFELPNAYNETTDVTANFSTEGTYTFTIKVCTVDSGNNILSTVCAETITVNVSAAA